MSDQQATEQELEVCKKIQKYAHDNYENAGWDYVAECVSQSEMIDFVRRNNGSYEATLKHLESIYSVVNEMRQDAIRAGGEF